jgi:aminoglycoside phosphotransferase (APT) family kinase protein
MQENDVTVRLYLRAVRQAIHDVLRPEMQSAYARNIANLADIILTRLVAEDEIRPDLDRRFASGYAASMTEGLALLGDSQNSDALAALSSLEQLQTIVNRLGGDLLSAEPARAAKIEHFLSDTVAVEAGFRSDYEQALKGIATASSPPAPEQEFKTERLDAYLQRRFASGPPVRLRSAQKVPGGRNKATILFEIEPHAALPEAMVIRMDLDTAVESTVRDEFPLIRVMFEAGVPVPEPLWLETDRAVLGAPFFVMRRMKGKAPGTLFDTSKVSPAIGLALAEALAQVHKAPAASIWPEAKETPAQVLVERMVATFEDGWRISKDKPSVIMECAFAWMRYHLRDLTGPAVPIHADAHFENILVEGDKLVCLLDWEFAHLGHPAEDLGYCRPFIEQIMPWDDFYARYRACGGREVSAAELRFFWVWGAARNASMATSTLRSMLDGRKRDIQTAAIGINTRVRCENLVAARLKDAMTGVL